jgi:two-component system osmolarity sensor histidine kinase EnvZ
MCCGPTKTMPENFIKRLLPRNLLGRSLMIIVTPLVLLQIISGFIFYDSHWGKVSLRMARSVAGDIGSIINLMRQFPGSENRDWIFDIADQHMEIAAVYIPGEILPNVSKVGRDLIETTLIEAMTEYLGRPFQTDTISLDRHVKIKVQMTDGVLQVITTRKRLYSSTTYIFVLWMVGTSMILFGVAVIFMRNQVKPIRRLAFAADNFGKGRDVPGFKPEGAREVRQAAMAFLSMRDRLQRQITQRTDMLAGVSHDLRTPLTRMKLQLELLGAIDGIPELKTDVADMEHMLEGYLAFARGEGGEASVPTNLTSLLNEVVVQARRKGNEIDLHIEGDIQVAIRPIAFKRCLTNLIDNSIRYANYVSVRAGRRNDAIEITIDDDGPGISTDKREEVFRPFYRIDGSRNPVTGGVGLGLTIARDVARSHGGDIELADSPSGGLRARLRLPL